MKQVFNKKNNVEVEDVPSPSCGDNEVLVKVHYSAVSIGTELASIRAMNQPLYKTAMERKDLVKKALYKAKKEGYVKTYKFARQMIKKWWQLGYSCAGEVLEVGKNVHDFNKGDFVACAGQDYASHAEYVTVPSNLVVKVPKSVSLKQASFTTIGSIAMQGVRRLDPKFGETVVVFGLGLIGQITAKILKAAGCEVIGVDISAKRVEMADVDKGFTKADINGVMNHTKNIGADGVIITAAAKSSALINDAMSMCRKKGKVVVLGKVGMDINRKIMYEKELDVLISTSYGPGRYDPEYEEKGRDYPIAYVRWTENRNMQEFVRLLAKKKISLENLIEKEYNIEDASKAYKTLMRTGEKPMGVVFSYDLSKKEEDKKLIISDVEPVKRKINVALIGAGNFVKSVHVPNLKMISDFNIRVVVTKTGPSAKQVAKKVKASYCTTDYMDALNDKNVDLVIIGTRHNSHAQITIDALNKGKHVFCEKPMCLNKKECREIINAYGNKKLVYTIGFNRYYSPAMKEIKTRLKNRTQPLMIIYRVNTKPTKKQDWVNDPEEGGGRIYSDIIHMFSFMNSLTDSAPKNIKASRINDKTERYVNNNNLSVTITYEDGSVGTLFYTDMGNEFFPKERVEVFSEGDVYVIDDFEKLTINKKTKSMKQDKGHLQELIELRNKLKGKEADLLDINHAIDVMKVCFKVEEILGKE